MAAERNYIRSAQPSSLFPPPFPFPFPARRGPKLAPALSCAGPLFKRRERGKKSSNSTALSIVFTLCLTWRRLASSQSRPPPPPTIMDSLRRRRAACGEHHHHQPASQPFGQRYGSFNLATATRSRLLGGGGEFSRHQFAYAERLTPRALIYHFDFFLRPTRLASARLAPQVSAALELRARRATPAPAALI